MWLARLHARTRNSKELHKRDCVDMRMLSCTRVRGCMDMCTLCGGMGLRACSLHACAISTTRSYASASARRCMPVCAHVIPSYAHAYKRATSMKSRMRSCAHAPLRARGCAGVMVEHAGTALHGTALHVCFHTCISTQSISLPILRLRKSEQPLVRACNRACKRATAMQMHTRRCGHATSMKSQHAQCHKQTRILTRALARAHVECTQT